ncbi:MAG: response regulator transcription factor [Saprospiraceae bacterium]|nr:response regulator transcription factor [Saprospiraceae bacterium]
MDKIKILVADDHKILIEGLNMLIHQEDDMEIVATAAHGKEVLEALRQTQVDVILLDINLPIINGIDLCRQIKAKSSAIRVLALTSYNKGIFIQQMLKAGASGYVLKNSASEEIVHAVRQVYAGETYMSPSVTNILMESLRNQPSDSNEFIPKLTKREKQVLKLIASEMTTKVIAQELHLSEHTVESHRRNLLTKFNVRNVVGLIRKAIQRGLIE